MANKSLFAMLSQWLPKPDTRNREGAPAYALTPKHALAQYAATGCLNSTFYADAARAAGPDRLALCAQVEDEFVAQYRRLLPRARAT